MGQQMLYIGGKKMKGNVIFQKDNEYYTPKYVVDFFFPNGFDYDPATCKEKAEEFNVPNYDTIETDGLLQDWTKYKRIWINPPFTKKHEFLRKAVETYNQVHNEIYFLFPIEFLTTARFHDLGAKCKLFIPKGRINFESGLGKKGGSPAFRKRSNKISRTKHCGIYQYSERRIIMRNINRIDGFLKKLGECWKLVPDWRFGQFMINFLGSLDRDPFFYEEDEMAEKLDEFMKIYRR